MHVIYVRVTYRFLHAVGLIMLLLFCVCREWNSIAKIEVNLIDCRVLPIHVWIETQGKAISCISDGNICIQINTSMQ
jgi:hypothetical protein